MGSILWCHIAAIDEHEFGELDRQAKRSKDRGH